MIVPSRANRRGPHYTVASSNGFSPFILRAVVEIPADARPTVDELRQIGGDELVRAMLATFVRYAEVQVAHLRDAAAEAQTEESATIAHTLKSSASQIGAVALADACARAELAALGDDVAAVVGASEEVAGAFTAARPWLDALAAS